MHYLEHGDVTTQSIALTGTDLKKDNTVFVMDNQTNYKVGTLWSMNYEFAPVKNDPAKQTIQVPGDYPANWIQQKNDEYKAFELAKKDFDAQQVIYNKYLSDKATYDAQDVFAKFWAWLTTIPTKVVGIPVWPSLPSPYGGKVVGTTSGDLVKAGGFGQLSAGMLKIQSNGRSFGTLGQGNDMINPADKTLVPFGGSMKGFVHPEQDISKTADCKKSTVYLTFQSKGAFPIKKSLKMNMKAVAWSTKSSLTLSAIPVAAVKPTIADRNKK